jgi:hypothetical protein
MHLLKPNTDNWIGYAQGYMHLLKPNTDNWIGYVQGYMQAYSIICVRFK